MIEIGRVQRLRASRRATPGVYLSAEEDEVLLPNRYVPEGLSLGESLKVFVYTDSEDRPVATTQTPKVAVGGVASLLVVDVGPHGAFLNWGLDKDLFAPNSLQRRPMRSGERHVVFAQLDERTGRVVATSRVERLLESAPEELAVGAGVRLLVFDQSSLGAHVVVNERHEGLVHGRLPHSPLSVGDETTGFVQRVRDDGKLDVALKPPGRAGQEGDARRLLEALDNAGGTLPLNDKSAPEEIAGVLSMSKKAFKKALGSLYRQRLVRLSAQGIRRVRPVDPAGSTGDE